MSTPVSIHAHSLVNRKDVLHRQISPVQIKGRIQGLRTHHEIFLEVTEVDRHMMARSLMRLSRCKAESEPSGPWTCVEVHQVSSSAWSGRDSNKWHCPSG